MVLDYSTGVLNFIGDNLPDGKTFTGKSVYISGAVYQGRFGVGDSTVTQGLQDQINTIISNTDPAALDSLSEIVTAFQSADSAFATTSELNNLESLLRNDLAFPSTNIEPAQTFTGDGTTTEFQLTASDLP